VNKIPGVRDVRLIPGLARLSPHQGRLLGDERRAHPKKESARMNDELKVRRGAYEFVNAPFLAVDKNTASEEIPILFKDQNDCLVLFSDEDIAEQFVINELKNPQACPYRISSPLHLRRILEHAKMQGVVKVVIDFPNPSGQIDIDNLIEAVKQWPETLWKQN
jgi:hypothetical protein